MCPRTPRLRDALADARAELGLDVIDEGAYTTVSYGISRLVSMAVDGQPADALIGAVALELALGLCAAWVAYQIRA